MGARHLLEVDDLSAEELLGLVTATGPQRHGSPLKDRGVALLFGLPSARTRNAAEMAVVSLGGHPVTVRAEEVGIDTRETAEDVARTLACYHAALAARVKDHSVLERFVEAIDGQGWNVPVLNLLSDRSHPTEAVADLSVLHRHWGGFDGRRLGWVGDGNNVLRSVAIACSMVKLELAISTPPGFELDAETLSRCEELGGRVEVCATPEQAAAQADAIYTDVWVSMGQEEEKASRLELFEAWRVTERLFSNATSDALFLHCLPAHRGQEVDEEVLEGPRSVVWEQAAARREAIAGMLALMLA